MDVVSQLSQDQEASVCEAFHCRAYQMRAQIFCGLGNYQGAVECLAVVERKCAHRWAAYDDRRWAFDVDRLLLLAGVNGRIGQTERALDIAKKAKAALSDHKDHEREAAVLHELGTSAWRMGEYRESLQYLTQSLAIHRSVDSLHMCGIVLLAYGDYEQAETYFDEEPNEIGPEDPSRAFALHQLGMVYTKTKELELAHEAANEALAILKHPSRPFAESTKMLFSYGCIMLESGRMEKAEEAFAAVLRAANLQFVGYPAVDTFGDVYHALGRLHVVRGDIKKATEYFNRALAHRELWRGKEHPETADTLHELGCLTTSATEAAELLGHAKRIRELKLCPGHPDTKRTADELTSRMPRAQ